MKKVVLENKNLEKLKIYAWPLMLLLLGGLTLSFVGFPSFNRFLGLRNEQAEKKKNLASLTEKAASLSGLDRSDLGKKLEVAESALPSEKSIPGLLSGLERMAAESGAVVTAFQISPGIISSREGSKTEETSDQEVPTATPAVPFTLTLEGNYQSLKGFLLRLKKARRVLGLVKLSFINLQSPDNPETLRTNLSLLAYYQPLPPTPPPLEEKLEPISPEELGFLSEVESFEVISLAPPLLPAGKENPFAF